MAIESKSVDFEDVLNSELNLINSRRASLKHTPAERIQAEAATTEDSTIIYNTVGLSLSGGGIRSAAISLGVLQALDSYGVIDNVDYLSTVSGGGYIGASMTATMTITEGDFVFTDRRTWPFWPTESAVTHLRNYSNYLLVGGKHNLGSAVAIIVRGLIANLGERRHRL
jgi:patatin-like phospholipase